MEKNMLAALQYDLTVPTCYLFTARFRKAAGVQDDLRVSDGGWLLLLLQRCHCAWLHTSWYVSCVWPCPCVCCCCCSALPHAAAWSQLIPLLACLSLLQVNQMCEYLSELCLVDVSTNKHSLSMLSAAVLHVALTALGRADTYPRTLARHTRYRLDDIMPAAR